MNYEEAKKLLTENPQADVRYRDVNHVDFKTLGEEFRVWIEDGELVQNHPTSPVGTVSAPKSARYHNYVAEDLGSTL